MVNWILQTFAIILTIAGATPSQADQKDENVGKSVQQMQNESRSLTVGNLVGTEIVNDAGEGVGTFENVVIDPNSGNAYGIISVGGMLGIGSKEVALPLEDFRLVGDDELLLSGATDQQLEQARAYEETSYQAVAPDTEVMSLGLAGDPTTRY